MPRMGTTMAMLRQRECDAQAGCEVLSDPQMARARLSRALADDELAPAKRKRAVKAKKARARR